MNNIWSGNKIRSSTLKSEENCFLLLIKEPRIELLAEEDKRVRVLEELIMGRIVNWLIGIWWDDKNKRKTRKEKHKTRDLKEKKYLAREYVRTRRFRLRYLSKSMVFLSELKPQ